MKSRIENMRSKLTQLSVINSPLNRSQSASNIVIFTTLLSLLLAKENYDVGLFWISAGLTISILLAILNLFSANSTIRFIGFSCVLLAYSKGFWLQLITDIAWWLPALLFASSILFFLLLLPLLDTILFPTLIMGLIFIQLIWISGELWLFHNSWGNLSAFIGSILFTFTALITAINYYKKSSAHINLVIGTFYLLSQCLIILSTLIDF